MRNSGVIKHGTSYPENMSQTSARPLLGVTQQVKLFCFHHLTLSVPIFFMYAHCLCLSCQLCCYNPEFLQ